MTIEIVEFKCPTCGHLMGEEEYEIAIKRMNKIIQETSNGQIEKIKSECDVKVHNVEIKANSRILAERDQHSRELENRANQLALVEIKKIQSKNDKEKQENTEAIKRNDEKHRQKETEHRLQLDRARKDIEQLQKDNQKLQKTLDTIAPERKGTAAEIILFDDLHAAFPQDHLMPKIVGKEMPDVVQTIVLDNGDKLSTPIAWDSKTGDCITAKDIKQAKRYKKICNTDCSIIVSAKGITEEDSEGGRAGLIGFRDGILLVHPSVVVGVAKLVRASLIQRSRLVKNNTGVRGKQAKLYEYITSQSRFRKMVERTEKKAILEDSIRRAEEYMERSWSEQRNEIQRWFETDRDDEKTINDILQEGDCNE